MVRAGRLVLFRGRAGHFVSLRLARARQARHAIVHHGALMLHLCGDAHIETLARRQARR